MENKTPPFKIDIAGTFLVPAALREAREQFRNGQASSIMLRQIEDKEIKNLVERLKENGLRVVTDGRFRSENWPLDFICGLEGIHYRNDKCNSVELVGRLDVHGHPVFEHYLFLTGVTGGDVIAKQVIPAPSLLLAELMKEEHREEINKIYPEHDALLEDIVRVYQKLIMELYKSGCRYLQLDDSNRTVTDDAVRVNNRVMENLPPDLFIAFHSPTEMLFSLKGFHAFFLDYDSESCDKNRLLWFIREQQSAFGFVLSHYPVDEELEELNAKVEQIVQYIPLNRFSLCLPNAKIESLETYEMAEQKQWHTLKMMKFVSDELWPEEE
ncbi:methionine synthase [Bacteroides sp.]